MLDSRTSILDAIARNPGLFDDLTHPDWFVRVWMQHDGAAEVVGIIEHYSLTAVNRGKRYGMKTFIELARWDTGADERSEFKINNNIAPFLSRLLAAEHPVLDGYFRIRTMPHAA